MQRVIQDNGELVSGQRVELTNEVLLQFYRVMQLSRAIDRKCLALQRQGRITFYGTSVGQEAAFVGSTAALENSDWLFPHYRGQTSALAKGITTREFFSELFANIHDPAKGRQLPLFFANRRVNFVSGSSPVGNMIGQAVGAAMAMGLRGKKTITMVHFGEGGTSTAEFHAGMNFAGVFKAPVVLVCINNQYAISVPLSRQTASESIAIKAEAYGFRGVKVDGNDVLAVYQAAKTAVDDARNGKGPTLLEALTYRLEAHSTSDDPSRYRSDKEVKTWSNRDPITRFRTFLERRGLWDDKRDGALLKEIENEVDEAVKSAEGAPPPPVSTLVEDVFADVPWHLREQIDELTREGVS